VVVEKDLKHISDALCKYVDEDLVISGAGRATSPLGSTVLTLASATSKWSPPSRDGGKVDS
ncbi:PREDICTED: uncharacterized protein, partial [Prunus dulcis]